MGWYQGKSGWRGEEWWSAPDAVGGGGGGLALDGVAFNTSDAAVHAAVAGPESGNIPLASAQKAKHLSAAAEC
jgi:hypothetical protein